MARSASPLVTLALCLASLWALQFCAGPDFVAPIDPVSKDVSRTGFLTRGRAAGGARALRFRGAETNPSSGRTRTTRDAGETLVLSPDETYEAVVSVGEARLNQTTKKILRDGMITGCYIGFGGVLCSTVGGSAMELVPGMQRFLFGAIGFPLSIFLTTIAGGQGFTPNVGVMASAFIRKGALAQRSVASLGTKLKVLGLAYLGNTAGLLTIAYLANLAALPAVPAAIEIAKHKCELSFLQVLVRGVLGGWLIGLAVWTSVAAKDVASKFITIWLCISTYVICQYEHCLANLFFVPCAIFAGAPITWETFIMANLIPSTIGNAIGGALMLGVSQRLALGSKKK